LELEFYGISDPIIKRRHTTTEKEQDTEIHRCFGKQFGPRFPSDGQENR